MFNSWRINNMKKILLLLFVLFSAGAIAQELNENHANNDRKEETFQQKKSFSLKEDTQPSYNVYDNAVEPCYKWVPAGIKKIDKIVK